MDNKLFYVMQISLFDTSIFILINRVILLNLASIDSNKICCDNNNVKDSWMFY